MKNLHNFLLIASLIVSGCAVPVAEERVIDSERVVRTSDDTTSVVSPAGTYNISGVNLRLNAVFVLGEGIGHCTAFAVGPRDVMTAGHCVSADSIRLLITHPVTGSRVQLSVVDVEYDVWGNYDRARLLLPTGSPNFKEWFDIGEVHLRDAVIVIGKRNQHYFLGSVESQTGGGNWWIRSEDGAVGGDSGAPVISVYSGKIVGINISSGTYMTPVYGF